MSASDSVCAFFSVLVCALLGFYLLQTGESFVYVCILLLYGWMEVTFRDNHIWQADIHTHVSLAVRWVNECGRMFGAAMALNDIIVC